MQRAPGRGARSAPCGVMSAIIVSILCNSSPAGDRLGCRCRRCRGTARPTGHPASRRTGLAHTHAGGALMSDWLMPYLPLATGSQACVGALTSAWDGLSCLLLLVPCSGTGTPSPCRLSRRLFTGGAIRLDGSAWEAFASRPGHARPRCTVSKSGGVRRRCVSERHQSQQP